PRPRRDRADLARRGPDRGVRKQPGCGMREAGRVVKTYTIAVLPGDGIGPEVIAEAERALEAAGDRFGIEFTLRRFPVGAAGVADRVRRGASPAPPRHLRGQGERARGVAAVA